jgi:protein-L-isoaspartate(D-aspartate) O-methyltransferase
MVRGLRSHGVTDERVLEAMGRLPRELFAPEALAPRAYEDHALPVVDGQTLTRPATVAQCAAEVVRAGAQRVLEVGTGSGYQAAVLASVCRQVFSVERHAGLLARARATLNRLGIANVALLRGDGSVGWSRFAPYDAVVVAAAADAVPQALLAQVGPGGVLIVPVGGPGGQRLLRVTRTAGGSTTDDLGPCSFVPLVGGADSRRSAADRGAETRPPDRS